MRIRILKSMIDYPKNANQLSKEVGVNYRTIEHHLKVLEENNVIMTQGEGYGKIYFMSSVASANIEMLREMLEESDQEGDSK